MLHPDSKIFWEDFSENYEKSIPEFQPSDIDDDEDEDFDESEAQGGMTAVFSNLPGFMGGGKQTVSTPWGQFLSEDKFSPTEFYNLKVLHFYKFSVYTIPDFINIMDGIDGVAIWKCQDPYCIILGKGKIYEWKEVVANVEIALLGKQQIKTQPEINQLIDVAQDIIKLQAEVGVTNYISVIFPNGKCVNRNYNPEDKEEYDRYLSEARDLINTLPGIIVIQDGEILCK